MISENSHREHIDTYRTTELFRRSLYDNAVVMEDSRWRDTGNNKIFHPEQILHPSHFLFFGDAQGAKSIAIFSLCKQDGRNSLSFHDINGVERWLKLQTGDKRNQSVDARGVWYFVPSRESDSVGGLVTHEWVVDRMEEEIAYGGFDEGGSITIEPSDVVPFELVGRGHASEVGWLNHVFVSPPPPRQLDETSFHFEALAVVNELDPSLYRF